jgi:hypothetical protein
MEGLAIVAALALPVKFKENTNKAALHNIIDTANARVKILLETRS